MPWIDEVDCNTCYKRWGCIVACPEVNAINVKILEKIENDLEREENLQREVKK